MIKCLKNIEGTICNTFIYTFAETSAGTSLQNLSALQQQYRKAIHQMTELVVYSNCFYFLHFFRPWLHFDWIFSLTSKGREQTKILKILHRFTEQVCKNTIKLYHKPTNGQYLKEFDNRDDNETMKEMALKRFSMLDLLIAESRKDLMTDIDIREEIDAFVFAGYDSAAVAVSFILAQLAEHKDIQDLVRNEVDSAIQRNEKKFTFELLKQLLYLERCIKEGEDVKLQSYLIPAGTMIIINIYAIHRNPNFWPNSEVFDPDRFLSKKIRNRHPYSYMPLDCDIYKIFQRFDMLEMKTMIASVIHNFYLEPIDYLKHVQLQTDITLCPTQSLRIRFISIHKINAIKYRFNICRKKQTSEK
ncbi:CP4C1 protein, partial [Acromyrmex charruanus]